MHKKLIDTNIIIDRFRKPALHQHLFHSDGLIYLSSVVCMELKAGAHTRDAIKAFQDLLHHFQRVDRIIVPAQRDYEQAGHILAQLQASRGYILRKSASLSHDCLIAASARSIGAVLYTRNIKDFEAIKSVMDFKVEFV